MPLGDTLKRAEAGAGVRVAVDRAARRAVVRADAADVPLRDSQPRAAAGATSHSVHRRGAGGRGARASSRGWCGAAPPTSRSPIPTTSRWPRRSWPSRARTADHRTVRIGNGFDVHALVAGPPAGARRRDHPVRPRARRTFRRRRAAARDLRRDARRARAGRHRHAFPRHRCARTRMPTAACCCATSGSSRLTRGLRARQCRRDDHRAGAEARAALAAMRANIAADLGCATGYGQRQGQRRPSAWASPDAAKASPRMALARAVVAKTLRPSVAALATAASRARACRRRRAASRSKRAAVQARDAIDDREAQAGARGAAARRIAAR